MSSTDESIRYVGENLGEDPSKATSKRSGSHPQSSTGGRRWSLRQAARHLLDESSTEEDDEKEEDSSPGERDIVHREEKGLLGTRGSRLPGSAYPCSPPPGYMSFFASQLRAGLRFPLPSFFCDTSHEFQVLLNQLAPNSISILVAFSVVFQYNNLIPTFRVFSQCFQLKITEPGVFLLVLMCGVSFLPTLSPPSRWKGDLFFIFPPRPSNVPHRWIYDSPPAVPFSLADRTSNLCAFLDKLNEKAYDCKELAEERLLSHFSLSPRAVPLQEPLNDIMFSKHLRDEHRATTTSPVTRSSKEIPSSSD
ncbi:UNVERIFIED_CONTAM: hypothetical protein Sradi_0157800 [Sesamum radiatum]|uniref:Transposase (putative) gypsy type domain-containing protein n=1 Tax=Sesamum radiatum TaxID=300843 RepID=A0AAW2WJY4_SESRA